MEKIAEHFKTHYPNATITKDKALAMIDGYVCPSAGQDPLAQRMNNVFGERDEMNVAELFAALAELEHLQ